MVQVCFTDDMVCQLKWLKGKELKNIICVSGERRRRAVPKSVYGNLFLEVENKYIEIGNLFESVNYFGGTEDISMLCCHVRYDIADCRHHECTHSAKEYIVNDIIETIIVLRDIVAVYQNEFELKYVPDNYSVDKKRGERELVGVKDLNDVKLKPYIYKIVVDQALVLECRDNTYIFLRGSMFTEELLISVNRDYMDEIYSVDEVKRYWRVGNEGLRIEVKREEIRL